MDGETLEKVYQENLEERIIACLSETRGISLEKAMFMYGKEASNRKQEIDRQLHTIPNQRNQRLKDKHYGNVHNRLWNHG